MGKHLPDDVTLRGAAINTAEANDEQNAAPDEMIPVVITAADIPVGLGLARALRGLGVPIYGLASDRDSPCCRSSAWSASRRWLMITSGGCSRRYSNSPLVIPGKSSSPLKTTM